MGVLLGGDGDDIARDTDSRRNNADSGVQVFFFKKSSREFFYKNYFFPPPQVEVLQARRRLVKTSGKI